VNLGHTVVPLAQAPGSCPIGGGVFRLDDALASESDQAIVVDDRTVGLLFRGHGVGWVASSVPKGTSRFGLTQEEAVDRLLGAK